jgi:hypothetical protein
LVPFNVEWTAAILRAALTHRGIEGGTLVEVYLDLEFLEGCRPVLSAVFPGFRAEHFARSGAGQSRRTLRFENRIGPTYFRGIAKIAFHGALKLIPDLRGDEWEFGTVRRFIRDGHLPFVQPIHRVYEPIIAGVGGRITLRDWGHVIAVEADHQHVTVRLQFFIGPSAIPATWVVRLGRKPASFEGKRAVGYYARYLDGPSPDGHTGEMIALGTARSSGSIHMPSIG